MCSPWLRVGSVALACATFASSASAQQLNGTLRRASDSLPVLGALVILGDSAGHDVARTISNERGRFVFTAPAGGTYRVRVLRIGLRPFGPRAVAIPDSGRVVLDLFIRDVPIELPAFTVSGRTTCGAPSDASILGTLLTEARKAIALTGTTLDERRYLFLVETWQRREARDFTTIDSVPTVSVDRGWPIRSAPSDSLRVWGFVHGIRDSVGRETLIDYFGPDPAVLFADWFLTSHCLRVGRGPSPGLLSLDFRPERLHDNVDIAGSFVFDSASMALRELTWRWVGLPYWVPEQGPGGFVRFQPMPQGGWLPVAWSLRAPIEAEGLLYGRALGEYAEFGGRVTSRSDRGDSMAVSAAPGRASTSTIAGTVSDTTGRPLGDVRVSATPSDVRALTDSAGQFRLSGLRPGTSILHTQAVGFAPADFSVRVGPDSTLRVAIQLTSRVIVLDTVAVSTTENAVGLANSGFYERLRDRLHGAGTSTFISPEDINRQNPAHTTDLLHGVPGLNVRYDHGKAVVYGRALCQMNVWIDGHFMYELSASTTGGTGKFGSIRYTPPTTDINDFVSSGEVAAIEVYMSPAEVPRQFNNLNSTCGAIVIWTGSRR